MADFIWSFEDLSALCQHKKAMVREWAVERLSLLYPERAGDIAIRLLDDEDAVVGEMAVYHFLVHPQGKYKDPLLNLYKKSSGHSSGKFANILTKLGDNCLIDAFKKKYDTDRSADLMGYSLSVLHIARLHEAESKEIAETSLKSIANPRDCDITIAGLLFDANLEAGTDIDKLLNFCYRQPDNLKLMIKLLTEIGEDCGSWHIEDDFKEEGEKGFFKYKFPKMIQESLNFIESHGYIGTKEKIERLFKKERYDEIVSVIFDETSLLLEAKKREYGEGDFIVWQRGRGKPRQNISAVSAFRDAIKAAPEGFKRYIAKASLSIFARLIEYRGLIGLNIERMNREGILEVFLQERGDVEEDERLIEILTTAGEKKMVLEQCLKHIKTQPDSWANPRIARFIGNLKDKDAVAQLFKAETDYRSLWEEIVLTTIKLGGDAVSIVRPIFENFDENKISYALQILEDIPTIDSSDIIIKYWDTLYSFDKEGLLGAVRGIGDRRFIEFLKKDIKEGQTYEADVFYLLCLSNRVIDPQLKKAEEEIDRHDKEVRKRLDLLKSSDIGGLLRQPVWLELKCRACQRPYYYEVNKIMIDADSHDNHILDTIKCKNCGVVDNYEITPDGFISITSHLMILLSTENPDGKDLENSVIVIGKTLPVDGKNMSINEAVVYYEKRCKEYPGDPKYLVGYANILRNAKRTEDAIPYYKEAIKSDPLSVEAYVSLGDIAKKKGDYKTAYEYYRTASEIIHTGNFYMVKQDMDEFKEGVLDNLIYLEKKTGIRPAHKEDTESVVKYPKVGRNAPCPCGSGRKYKKCCLKKEAAAPAINPKEMALADRLISYSKKERFKKDFLNAVALYYRTKPVEPLILPERALEDKGRFSEWFALDYIMPSGRTIIEDFYSEMQDRLTEDEREILKSHMMSYMGIYEVLEVNEGVGLKIKDIFTGKEIEVREIKGSQKLVKWDIIMVRVYALKGVNRILSSTIQVISRDLKDGLSAFLKREFEKFKMDTGKTGWSLFMKKRFYIIEHYLEDMPEEKRVLLTEEGHKIILSKSHFDVRGLEDVIDSFGSEYDFVVNKVIEGREARLTWLKRGKSKEWEGWETKHEKGLIIKSQLIHDSGQLEWTVLGNITITPDRLILECLSKERLERGKQRLKEILNDLIIHRIDTFEDIEKAMESLKTDRKEREPESSPKGRLIMESHLIKQLKRWLDEKIPVLNGMTPREAVKTAEGREKVIEFIKDLENREEKKRKGGEPYFDVSIIKKELGIE